MEQKQEKKPPKITTKTVVLADGTYGCDLSTSDPPIRYPSCNKQGTQNVYEGGEGDWRFLSFARSLLDASAQSIWGNFRVLAPLVPFQPNLDQQVPQA